MRTKFKPVLRMSGVLLLVAVLSGIYSVPAFAGEIIIQECLVVVFKETDVSTGTDFEFAADFTSGSDLDFSIQAGEFFEFGLDTGQTVLVSEIVPTGWALTDVSCQAGGGITAFENGDNGFSATCIELGEVQCVFTNRLVERPIPTLSEWGMIAAAAGLMLVGVFFAVRKRRAFDR